MRREEYAADRRRAAYYWEARRHGLVVAAEFLPDGTLSGASMAHIEPPFELHARPYRPWDQRSFAKTIEPGDVPVWEHFVVEGIRVGPKAPRGLCEGLIFGRRTAAGREEVLVVLPQGQPIPASSLEAARAAIAEGAALFS